MIEGKCKYFCVLTQVINYKGHNLRVMKFKFLFSVLSIISLAFLGLPVFGVTIPTGGAKIFFGPSEGVFSVDSTFDVSILLDTGTTPVNVVDVKIEFPADKLQIVSPSTGNSFINLWIQQPTFSNTKGTISFVGGATQDGIKTSSGLVSTITFRAKQPGVAMVKISSNSSVLAADGLGTKVLTTLGRAVYNILPPTPEGPEVFSITHQDQAIWHKNNNVIMGWDLDGEASTSFSYSLSREPSEIPDNIDDTIGSMANFPDLDDGIWWFHAKQKKFGIYGDTSHYQLKIDTTPPAQFKPKIQLLTAAIVTRKAISTFFTTDALSGLNRYEVAVFDKSKDAGDAPIFIEASSPYKISDIGGGTIRLVVRAYDNAGNYRDGFIEIRGLNLALSILKENYIGLIIAFVAILISFLKHLVNHKKQNDIFGQMKQF